MPSILTTCSGNFIFFFRESFLLSHNVQFSFFLPVLLIFVHWFFSLVDICTSGHCCGSPFCAAFTLFSCVWPRTHELTELAFSVYMVSLYKVREPPSSTCSLHSFLAHIPKYLPFFLLIKQVKLHPALCVNNGTTLWTATPIKHYKFVLSAAATFAPGRNCALRTLNISFPGRRLCVNCTNHPRPASILRRKETAIGMCPCLSGRRALIVPSEILQFIRELLRFSFTVPSSPSSFASATICRSSNVGAVLAVLGSLSPHFLRVFHAQPLHLSTIVPRGGPSFRDAVQLVHFSLHLRSASDAAP